VRNPQEVWPTVNTDSLLAAALSAAAVSVCSALSAVTPSVLRTLVLSDNAALSGPAANLKLPSSVRALHIANTSIRGSFGAPWMGQQGQEFSCLVAYNTLGLCGQLDPSMPCSMTQFTQGTKLSKYQLLECIILAPAMFSI
jgi:hypothetical protein